MDLKFSAMIVMEKIESEIFIISQKSMNKVMTGKRTNTKV
jgi:hypothetical protein